MLRELPLEFGEPRLQVAHHASHSLSVASQQEQVVGPHEQAVLESLLLLPVSEIPISFDFHVYADTVKNR